MYYLIISSSGCPVALYPTKEDALLAVERHYYPWFRVQEIRLCQDFLERN